MIQKEKQLLLKDLCARLPYGVICEFTHSDGRKENFKFKGKHFDYLVECKPYLRSLSSMNEVEKDDYQYITERWMYDASYSIADSLDWLNEHHFDYRGLIERGLALEAPEGMYKTE